MLSEIAAQCGAGLSALVRDQVVPDFLRLFSCTDNPVVATISK